MIRNLSIMLLLLAFATSYSEDVDWNQIFRAIAEVESGCNDSAINIKENAHGRYQIRAKYLEDVNNYYGTSYTLQDMHNPAIARWAVVTYMKIYNAETYEQIARIHNGGPKGMSYKCTLQYWSVIKRRL